MYYVYVLKSLRTNRLYKGMTNSLDRRLGEHFSGKVMTTGHMLPAKLVFAELCNSRKEARKLEIYFKSGVGRETLAEVLELVDKQS